MDEEELGGVEQGSNPQPIEQAQGVSSDFTIPQEYQDRGWAKNIKSQDDLYKSFDNAQSLIGRKTIGIPTEQSTEQEWSDFYSKLTPEDINAYEFSTGNDEESVTWKETFKQVGLSTRQAKALNEKLAEQNESYKKMAYSPEEHTKVMSEVLGGEYTKRLDEISNLLEDFNPKYADEIKKMPNAYKGIVAGAIDHVMKKYNVRESNVIGGGSAPAKEPNPTGFYKDWDSMKNTQYTQADLEALMNKHNMKV